MFGYVEGAVSCLPDLADDPVEQVEMLSTWQRTGGGASR